MPVSQYTEGPQIFSERKFLCRNPNVYRDIVKILTRSTILLFPILSVIPVLIVLYNPLFSAPRLFQNV